MVEQLTIFADKIKKADSLVMLISSANKNENVNDIYYLFRAIGRYSPFGVNDRTIVQLRNAGGMWLITNKNISDSIVGYYRGVDNIKYLDERLIANMSTMSLSTDKLLDGIDWGKLTDTINNIIVRVSEPLKLRTTDAEIINAAIMNVQRTKNLTIAIRRAVKELQYRAKAIRHFILKEYRLENE